MKLCSENGEPITDNPFLFNSHLSLATVSKIEILAKKHEDDEVSWF
ncbi:hypothetical protein V512_008840 [Mesotoga sp. Brook.08.105.5.1]|nr:hypothetical protein V512_008840 [Mesotoga sp. Brook.08.105.5.1]RAO97040.1 hypothetical protein M388_12210 [Mesotoga sp. Brook.08.YT.4.2.5.4.]